MYAQRIVEEVRPPVAKPRKRKKTSLFMAVIGNRMACVMVAAVVVCLAASIYLGACDSKMKMGYTRAELSSHLSNLRKDNQRLRIEVEKLRQQDRIEAFAVANGMQRPEQTAYLEPVETPSVAQNPSPESVR